MPARMYVSTGLTATALTLTSTWLSAGFGFGRLPKMMFSAGPGFSIYAAFTLRIPAEQV